MSVERELAGLAPQRGMLLTIGVFDGVHLGHKSLLSELVKQAKLKNLISGVITFNQHPQNVLRPRSNVPFLTSLPQKIKLIKDEGVEVVITLTFTLELAQTGARQFMGLLKQYLDMRGLVLGPDFALGRDRQGDMDGLRTLGRSMGFELTVVSPITVNGEVVSSTAIRNELAKGNMEKVNRMLGRFFSLEGRVISGAGRGMELGFPTANLDIEPARALPADGIYATWAHVDSQRYPSVTNIGTRPTFGEGERTVEVYILNFRDNLYRHELKIDIIKKLRDEKKFGTAEELKSQIEEDARQTRAILDRLTSQ
jgi:riboflavin kinase/FMN adenylyltransferase